MKITMDMSSYTTVAESPQEEYGDEVMYAGLMPGLSTVNQDMPSNRHVALPASLANVDAEAFLDKMYAWQR